MPTNCGADIRNAASSLSWDDLTNINMPAVMTHLEIAWTTATSLSRSNPWKYQPGKIALPINSNPHMANTSESFRSLGSAATVMQMMTALRSSRTAFAAMVVQ